MNVRRTNLGVLIALLLAAATGVGAVATGSAGGRWVVIGHGMAGIALVLLIPWKRKVIGYGLRRRRATRWLSLALAVLVLVVLATGFAHGTGWLRSAGGMETLWWHVAFALALMPLAVWHIAARRTRPRRTDLSRRTLLRTGALGAAAAGLWVVLPGGERRFTGSYEAGSFDPPSMPRTIWLNDRTPRLDPAVYRLTAGGVVHSLPKLRAMEQVTWRVVLDCTSGWYAEQDWTGVPLSALVRPDARSVYVRSATGYGVHFPIGDLGRLLLATHVGGAPLLPGHGYPVRLVAPGRRGFWWVKWVERVELTDRPWWVQPPFPLS
jgi:hypothetical protein